MLPFLVRYTWVGGVCSTRKGCYDMIIPAQSFLPGLKDDGLMYVPRPIVELKGESVTLWDDIIHERLRPLRSHYPKSLDGQVVLNGWET